MKEMTWEQRQETATGGDEVKTCHAALSVLAERKRGWKAAFTYRVSYAALINGGTHIWIVCRCVSGSFSYQCGQRSLSQGSILKIIRPEV